MSTKPGLQVGIRERNLPTPSLSLPCAGARGRWAEGAGPLPACALTRRQPGVSSVHLTVGQSTLGTSICTTLQQTSAARRLTTVDPFGGLTRTHPALEWWEQYGVWPLRWSGLTAASAEHKLSRVGSMTDGNILRLRPLAGSWTRLAAASWRRHLFITD